MKALHIALYSALLLVALTVTVAILVVTSDLHQDLAATHLLLEQASVAEKKLDPILEQATASTQSLNKTIANVDTVVGILNDAATKERDNWQKTSTETAKTAQDVRELVDDFRKSAIHVNVVTLPAIDSQIASNGDQMASMLKKVGETAETMQPVMTQAQKDLGTLDVTIQETQPLVQNSTTTMANAARISGDLAKIVDDSTKPQPWYKKAWGYIWAPIKIGAVFLK